MKTLRPWLFFLLLCLTSLFVALWLRGGTDARPFVLLHALDSDIRQWYAHHDENSVLNAGKLQRSSQSTDSAIDGHTSISPADHTAEDQQACNRPRTKSRDDTDAQLVYRWVDDKGQTHISDQQPEGVIATVMDANLKKEDFTYRITPDGVSLPTDFPGQVSAGSKRIYDIWHFFIGEAKLRQSRIELLLIGGPGRFDAYHRMVSPDSKPVNGFYSMAANQAVVNFDPENMPRTLGTTFHEISHLITASHLGPTSPWLTEGLAEYFETMQVTGQTGAIYPNQAHLKLLKTTPLPRIRDYLSTDRSEWYGTDRDRNYAIAWSIMNFLLQGAPGMYALQEVIQQAEAHSCQPFSAVEALDHAYPGGIQRLDEDWRKWLSNGQFQTQQT